MKKKAKNTVATNILSALAVAFFGFILLNLTFIFDFLYQSIVRGIVDLFVPLGPETQIYWFPPLMHFSFVVIIGLISWFVFKSKLKEIYKAIFMTLPVAVVLVTLGMFLYSFPLILYLLGALLCACILYYFYCTKQPWIYYYSVILVSVALTLFTLLGGEI